MRVVCRTSENGSCGVHSGLEQQYFRTARQARLAWPVIIPLGTARLFDMLFVVAALIRVTICGERCAKNGSIDVMSLQVTW